ncbi:succinate dehydrogenase [Marimonas arenosa]|uniref:Succinate dehydrogenase n=1 Tax=Marimonas arenosa TaxID=1795305 RepID=A0AAE4B684_9RHOB|nr:succinate dehydrogenase [Marimonas arenosa]MDQ2092105.1 succinate dehydrogenase [Marimonas arenosa]
MTDRARRSGFAAALALGLALLALPGCDVAQQAADDVARGQAKRAVDTVVAERFPGVDATPVTDCIVDAASAQEILQIAGSSVTGAQAETTEMVLQIAQRPEAVSCFAGAGISLLKL